MPPVLRLRLKSVLSRKVEVKLLVKIVTSLIAVFLFVILYQRGIVAPVFINGEPVTLGEIMKMTREQGGPKNALDKIIMQKYIEYEARKRNIAVKQEEINAEIAKMEKRALDNGTTLIQLMKDTRQTSDDLEKNVKLQIMLYKIVSQDVDVSEEEIDQYIDTNSSLFKGKQKEEIRQEVKDLLISQKIQSKYNVLFTEAKAKTEVNFIINTH